VRLVHISDTHLGFSAYSKLDSEEGINQRELDIYHAFERAIDKAIALKPDIVVHSGDLFDSVRPQNRAIDFALKQLIRLSHAGIETVLISGNHSTPRLRETGNIFRIFEHLDHIHSLHEPGIAKMTIGGAHVVAIPHSANPSIAELAAKATPSKDAESNILVLHAGILGSDVYRMDEFNEQAVPVTALDKGWDYVALGHYHQHNNVAGNAYYSGSTERIGFGEVDQKKGIVEVDLTTHTVRFHELGIRDMLDLPALDATGLASSEILSESRKLVSGAGIEEKIVRMVIVNVAADAYRSLDVPAIRQLGSSALHFELRVDRQDKDERTESGDTQIGLLADEFKKFVSKLEYSDAKKARLLELGMPYLERDDQ
jgi:DNA repair exonuclease SbcCD nuclease subunit